MNTRDLLRSRPAAAVLAGILYVAGKSLAQFLGLDDSAGNIFAQALGLGNTGLLLVWAVGHCDGMDGPVVLLAKKVLETGKLQDVAQLISKRLEQGLHRQFENMMKKKKYNPDDVAAGRAFASAYVEYTHYVERLYNAAETLAPGHVQKEALGLAHSH